MELAPRGSRAGKTGSRYGLLQLCMSAMVPAPPRRAHCWSFGDLNPILRKVQDVVM